MKEKSKLWLVIIIVLAITACDNFSSNNDTVTTPDYALRVHLGENVIRKHENVNLGEVVQLTGITWNGTTLTLNLNNFSFETTSNLGLDLPMGNITIILNGTNIIKSTGVAIVANSNGIIIEGSGSLTATGTGHIGINLIGTPKILTISGSTVNAHGRTRGMIVGSLIINNGANVTATADISDSSSLGIWVGMGGELSLNNGMVTMSGNRAVMNYSEYPSLNYTIPNGFKYWVSTTTTPNTTELIGNGISTVIDSTHKWARVQTP